MWLETLRGFLGGGRVVGRALVFVDWTRLARIQFLHAALESGLLNALRAPRTRDELIADLDVRREEILDGLLAEGLAWRELAERGGRFRLRGRRARALVTDTGDAYAALLHESVSYHGSAFSSAGRQLRGEPPGQYLDTFGEVVARSSRMIEPPTRAFLKRCLRRVRPASVLDIGCGSGTYLRHAAAWSPGIRAVGVETSEAAARHAVANLRAWNVGDRCRVAPADVFALPSDARGPYDLVLLFHNIYYFEPADRPRLFRTIKEVLSPSGALALVSYFKGGTRTATHFDMVLRSTEGNTALPTLEDTVAVVRDAGFEVDRPVRLVPREPLFGLLAR